MRGSRAEGAGKKSEVVTVRLDPKLKYLAELAARKHRRPLSSYIEWAVEQSLSRVWLDEPFNGLDFLVKEDVASSMLEYASQSNIGVVLVTHDISDAASLCDRIVVLGKGSVTQVVAEVEGKRPDSIGLIEAALRATS